MARAIIDWETIERDYRAGVKSLRVMAAEHGVSNAAIHQRSTKKGWSRDLSAKIRANAKDLVSKSVVSTEVSSANQIAEKDVIEANSEMISGIILAHRRDIQRTRSLAMRLLTELEQQTDGRSLIDQLRLMILDQEGKKAQDRDALIRRMLSLGNRSSTMKTLADTLRGLVTMEREAFGIKGDAKEDDEGIEGVIKRVMAKQEG